MADSSGFALSLLVLTGILIVYLFLTGTYQELISSLGMSGEVRGDAAAIVFVLAVVVGLRSYRRSNE